MRILVTGAGGFIGHHLVNALVAQGHWVRGVDLKYPEFEETKAHSLFLRDLQDPAQVKEVVWGVDQVYHLAADMGGIGYISKNHATIARNNLRIDSNILERCLQSKVRLFFASSACIYPQHIQTVTDCLPLPERLAYPANPEEGYGWAKLFTEKLCQYYQQDFGLNIRIARFHNVYGPLGTFQGGKEKAPAAICRKVALAKDTLIIWGDGQQTRTFMYIDDCIEGILRIMESDYPYPLNLGSDEVVTINQMADMVCAIASKELKRDYHLNAPQGVRGRSSDNTLIKSVLGWAPSIPLEAGLAKTYPWILQQVRRV